MPIVRRVDFSLAVLSQELIDEVNQVAASQPVVSRKDFVRLECQLEEDFDTVIVNHDDAVALDLLDEAPSVHGERVVTDHVEGRIIMHGVDAGEEDAILAVSDGASLGPSESLQPEHGGGHYSGEDLAAPSAHSSSNGDVGDDSDMGVHKDTDPLDSGPVLLDPLGNDGGRPVRNVPRVNYREMHNGTGGGGYGYRFPVENVLLQVCGSSALTPSELFSLPQCLLSVAPKEAGQEDQAKRGHAGRSGKHD